MRFCCPSCETWQQPRLELSEEGGECSCRLCGTLLLVQRSSLPEGPEWIAEIVEQSAVPVPAEDPVQRFLADREDGDAHRRAERFSGVSAQLLALTTAWSPRLWLPAAAVVGLGFVAGGALLTVGHRVERSFTLLLLPVALGVVAWSMVLAASAVANLLHVRLQGAAIGMGRSLRMILEHGNGATRSALRYVALGVVAALGLGLLCLTGALPGLAGPSGLVITGLLMWLQILAAAAAIGVLAILGMALLIHPGLAAAGAQRPDLVFRFVLGLLRRETPEMVRRTVLPLGATVLLLVSGWFVLRWALRIVFAINEQVLGPKFAELVAASPIRVIVGAPELLDPGFALDLGGIFVALSLLLCLAILHGFVASFMGISGYLLSRGLHLPERLKSF
jgi:hypothetical protein